MTQPSRAARSASEANPATASSRATTFRYCSPPDRYAQIRRINLDGTGAEIVARGVRNTLGFDWDPRTGDLWFTDNQRDWLAEDMPPDELNRVGRTGGPHFGFPYCHAGIMADPQLGWGHSCDEFVKPAALLGAHSAPLGMRFYSGRMFPRKYHGAIFIARHGSWNRTHKYGADVVVAYLDGGGNTIGGAVHDGVDRKQFLPGPPSRCAGTE